jgi:nucleoside-diphosphate-sugar epimerase
LIIGCGDVGCRVASLLQPRWRVLALTSTPARCAELRQRGIVPLVGNLDDAPTLARLAGLADAVLHLAPPQGRGERDERTRNLIAALARGAGLRRLVYVGTTGVYGDTGGARVAETRTLAPSSPRARRRADAEAQLRAFGRASGVAVTLLRAPGIYAGDRPGHPSERLRRGTAVLARGEDVFTSHIHADDLARACALALHRGMPQRAFNACDHTELPAGDYFDLAADLLGLPRPPRITRAQAGEQLSPMQLSFLSESRRLSNERLVRELRLRLRYPTVREGLTQG